jgi:hypothetical protein
MNITYGAHASQRISMLDMTSNAMKCQRRGTAAGGLERSNSESCGCDGGGAAIADYRSSEVA